jgi:hypothetical protein
MIREILRFLAGGVVSWMSKLQSVVALSTKGGVMFTWMCCLVEKITW